MRVSRPMEPETIRRALEDDPRATAEAAGLRYVSDDDPGYTRRRCGRGFTYRDSRGRTVRDEAKRSRFEDLAIPPAWTDVWICRHEDGHLQATGRDDEDRKQYVYHPRFREARERAKYDRMVPFARLLPRIRRRVRRDLGRSGLPREKVLAAVVRLLESSRARVGNDEYARRNGSYGLTTLRKRHVETEGGENGELVLDFPGKGGKPWRIEVDDPGLVEVVVECLQTPGWRLFKYFDESGEKREVTADDVNEYLASIADAPVRAKDFRTWNGTVLAAAALREIDGFADESDGREPVTRAIERVAEQLGNTPAICRACYVHPRVLEAWEEGELLELFTKEAREARRPVSGLTAAECAILCLLAG